MANKNINQLPVGTIEPFATGAPTYLYTLFEAFSQEGKNVQVVMPFYSNGNDMVLSGNLYPNSYGNGSGSVFMDVNGQFCVLPGANWFAYSQSTGTQLLVVNSDQLGYNGDVVIANSLTVNNGNTAGYGLTVTGTITASGKITGSGVDPDWVNYVPHTKAEIQTLVANEIASLQSSVTTLTSTISTLHTEIATATGASLARLQGLLANTQTQLSTANEGIASMQNGANDCFITNPASGPSPIRAYYIQSSNTFYNMIGTVI